MADSTIANSNSTSSDTENGSGYAEIIVVRHGETAWNVEGRLQVSFISSYCRIHILAQLNLLHIWNMRLIQLNLIFVLAVYQYTRSTQGHLDVELNEVGRQQAAAVADRLSKESAISAVYSSDLKRAFETAHIIASSCGVPQVIQDPDLRERHLGNLQGLTSDEAEKLTSNTSQARNSPRTDDKIPGGGESFDQLYLRCTSSLQRIGMKHKGERVVVVTHGGVVRALHKRAAPKEILKGKIVNASLNVFHLTGHEWIIKTWSDTNHLHKTGYLETAFGGDSDSG